MKVGIDSYCYHRFFGEVYEGQQRPDKELTLEAFLDKSKALGVDGVSLESCFIPKFESGYLAAIKTKLDSYNFDRVYAWGHADGLEGGSNEKALDEMIEHIEYAYAIGASVMRVVGSSLKFRFEPHSPQLEKLTSIFSNAVKIAEKYGIKLAIENHIDYNSDEILKLLKDVNSPFLGINFDTGNFLRVMDDPVKAMEKLAPYVFATHIKDLLPVKGVPVDEWYFFSCVPAGEGLINNEKIAQILHAHNYKGFLAVETDFLHPTYANKEDEVILKSIKELKRIANTFN